MIAEFNPAAEALWGHARAEMLGRPAALLAPPDEHHRLGAMLRHQSLPGKAETGRLAEAAFALARDGRRIAIEVNVGRAGECSGRLVTIFCRDISERIAAEQHLSELSAELAHVSRQHVMSELAADLAHELNQPLSAATNFLATARVLIGRGETGMRIAEFLGLGENQLLRAGDIIQRLRNFLAKRDVEMCGESLEAVVQEAIDLVLFGAAQLATRVVMQLDPAGDWIFADRIQVQQVLVNLLRNSLEALHGMPIGVRPFLVASCPAGGCIIEISVSVNGPGLPPELRDVMFSRFTTRKPVSGMGIGLSISRRIVEAHGGTLVAENQPEGGAVFRFTMPALLEPAGSA